jgi:hypothetical protein
MVKIARNSIDMDVTGHKTIFSYNPLRQKARMQAPRV